MLTSILYKLPYAIVGLLLALAVVIIYFRSRKLTRSEFFKVFKDAKYIQAWVLIVVFVFTGIFGVLNHLNARNWVSAVVALNYSEASLAQNSNGTRYNMAEITCDEVIEKAIEKGAFENVTVKDLKSCLSVYPYVQGDVQDKSQYHISTEFVVEYCASRKTRHLDAENVIQLITSSYKEYYIEKYTDSFKLEPESEWPDFTRMEYMDIVLYFNKEATETLNYLYGLAERGPSFVTSNGTTFNSIAGKVHQFKQTQIEENFRSLILQNGIVRDKSGYIDRLSYQNINTDFDRQKNVASFDLCNKAIAMYSEEMTRVVLVPTWDEVGKYYMGRTKVGIDELSVKATAFSDNVANNEKEIMDNNLVIGKMQNATGASVNVMADSLVENIHKSLVDFKKEAIAAGREFSNYRMNQCIAVSVSGISLFGELKDILIFAVAAYIAIILYVIAKKDFKKE